MITELRALQKLQQIVPILIRHLDAYVELAEEDLAQTAKSVVAKAKAMALLAISGVFALFMLCILVIGATWDGEYRLAAIGGLAGFFILVSAIAAVVLIKGQRNGPFANLRREWRQDRAIFESWLTHIKDEKAEPHFTPPPYSGDALRGARPGH